MKKSFFKSFMTILITVLISVCFCLNLFGSEDILPDAEEIIEKNLEAMGGRSAFEKMRNQKVEITAGMVTMGLDIKLTTYKERPDRNYTIADMGAMGEVISGSDGNMAWEISPFTGTRILEGRQLASKLLENSFDGPDAWKKMYKRVRTLGTEMVDGRSCYKVEFISDAAAAVIKYYDSESYLEVKSETEGRSAEGPVQVEQFFEDYENSGGILFPLKTNVYVMGSLYQIVTVDSVEINKKMPDGIFDLPEEIKALIEQEPETAGMTSDTGENSLLSD